MSAFSRTSSVQAAALDHRAVTPDMMRTARRPGVGNQAWLRRMAADHGGGAGLVIGDRNDPLEHEADQVADRVMQADASQVRRKCSACEDEEKSLRAKASGAAPAQSGQTQSGQAAPAAVHEVIGSPGRPMDASLRSFFEPRFGADFGTVRLHTDAQAGASARSVGALAYAVDNHVVVDPDHYRPDSPSGRRLLAHELTHTLQQGSGSALPKLRRAGDGEAVPQPEPLKEGDEETEADSDEDETAVDEDDDGTEDGDTPVDGIDETPDIDLGALRGLGSTPSEDPAPPPEAEPMAGANGEATADPAPLDAGDPEPEGRDPGKKKPSGRITHIDVDQTAQRMVLTYANGATSDSYVVSTGRGECGTKDDPCQSQNNHNCTPNITNKLVTGRGTAKQKNGHGDDIWWFVGLDTPGRKGIGIHNSQKADGNPRSHGCVRTGPAGSAGEKLAELINKQVLVKKTTVTISGKAKTKPYPCPAKKKAAAPAGKTKKKGRDSKKK